MTAVFILAGAAAGLVQALLLRRAARAEVGSASALLRLLLIGSVLVAAALEHHLLAGVAGWASGHALGVFALVWTWS